MGGVQGLGGLQEVIFDNFVQKMILKVNICNELCAGAIIVKVSFQLWRPTNNKKRALIKMPFDK